MKLNESAPMRFTALDSWRGIAALLVALFHLDALGHFYGVPFVRNSHFFVDFFFVLSGFVISYSSYGRLTNPDAFAPFMIKRFGRVYPLHAVMLIAFIAFPLAEWTGCRITGWCGAAWPFNPQRDNVWTVLANVFLVQAMGIYDTMSWNWPSWSISTEFWTYVVFAVAAIAFRKVLVPVAGLIAVASLLAIFLFAPRYAAFSYSFLRCTAGFFAGFLIFRLYQSGRLPLRRFGSALELLSVGLIIGFVSLVGESNAAFSAPLVFAVCVYVFAHQSGIVSSLLTTRPFLKLGEWSYSIYMIHAFVLIVMLRLASMLEKILGQPVRVEAGFPARLYYYHDRYAMDGLALIYLLIVVALSGVVFAVLEAPARDYFNRLAKNWRAERIPADQAVAALTPGLSPADMTPGGSREP